MRNHLSPLGSLVLAAGLLLFGQLASAAGSDPPTIAVLGFDLVDDHPDPARADLLRGRLSAITKQLEQGLHDRALYRVLDTAAAQDLIDVQRARN